jgi:peptidyl-prolyl cis-trans isomerase C
MIDLPSLFSPRRIRRDSPDQRSLVDSVRVDAAIPGFPKSAASALAAFARRTGAWLAVGTLLAACRPSPVDLPADSVAQIGTRVVSTAEFTEELRRRGVSAANDEEAARLRREVLEALVDEESMVQRATASGLDREPEVQRRIRRLLAQEYRERTLGKADPAPSEDELRNWYNAHVEEFMEPPQTRGQLISIRLPRKSGDELRQAARQRLTEARAAIEASLKPEELFAESARTISDDPGTRRQGGDTGWILPGRLTRWPDAVNTALLALRDQEPLSPILETPDGLYLLRLTERKPARVRPFEEVRPRVEHRVMAMLKERREREFIATARAAVHVRENTAALGAVQVPVSAPTLSHTPPSLPGTSTSSASQP